MENRDYLKMYEEDCDAKCECKDCEIKEECAKEIEFAHGIKVVS